MAATIIEPFRIKSVEPLRFTTKEQRTGILAQAFYNPFMIHADDVLIDLLTEEGRQPATIAPFKGNINLVALEATIKEKGAAHIAMCIITITNNSGGGHAVYLDAKAFLPQVSLQQYPGLALSNALYIEGGVRSVEIGSLMFGKYAADGSLIPAPMELVRLAIPRRVYTQSHIDYVAEIIIDVFRKRQELRGYEIVYEAPLLRHFTAKLKPV
ncbi:hypothetical protein [Niabella hirudinis]|uniref:hypothetical protein n=1 Tax=Niabella hirudinis TaxID=1285929 RepID=UPI003EBBE51F